MREQRTNSDRSRRQARTATHMLRCAARTLRKAETENPGASRLMIRRRAAQLANVQAVMARTPRSQRIGREAWARHQAIAAVLAERSATAR